MWPFKKRHQQFPILPFKSGEGFFRHWCDYGDNHLAADQPIVALVLDARKFAGTQTAVKTRDDGIQVAVVRIASDDGGFEVIAETAGHGDPLAPGDVVMWLPGQYLEHMAEQVPDPRSAWVGLIVAKVANEINLNTNQFRVTSWYRTVT